MTKDRQKARELWVTGREYHLLDAKAKVNFRNKLRRLAKKINPRQTMTDTDLAATVMYLDHTSLRTGITITYKEV